VEKYAFLTRNQGVFKLLFASRRRSGGIGRRAGFRIL
jgi:hypothetical protein